MCNIGWRVIGCRGGIVGCWVSWTCGRSRVVCGIEWMVVEDMSVMFGCGALGGVMIGRRSKVQNDYKG